MKICMNEWQKNMNLLSKEWQAAFAIIEVLETQGYEAVIVGGAVRDYLLRRDVHDVDVATNALPEEVKAIFPQTVDVGIAHGTVLVVHKLAPIEVTTFRTDGQYIDHRRPDSVQFVRSLEEDLLRRDFTINAMAMRADRSIVDLYGGQSDLNACSIRAVGNAQARFTEDALRMLRAVRFTAQLGFKIEDMTLHAIQLHAQDIQRIAQERVKAEFDKIWVSDFVYDGMLSLQKTTLSSFLLGNFNDTSWKSFKTTEPDIGWAYFSLLNRENMKQIVQHYRLSNKEKTFVKTIIEAYDNLITVGWQNIDYFRFELRVLHTTLQFVEYLHQTTNNITAVSIQQSKEQLVIQSKDELVVNGFDLLQWSDRKRGPWLKKVLDNLLLAVLNGECNNERTMIKEWYINGFNDEG